MPDSDPHLLHFSEHFRIEHAIGYRIAGLLFVMPNDRASDITELKDAALAALGPTLKLACRGVQAVMSPINVYYAKFGESGGSLHFHVFPRTEAITRCYLEANPDERIIDAPRLMSWANRRFSGASGLTHGDVAATIEAFRRYFASGAA